MCIWILYYNYEYSIDMYASDLTHKKRAEAVFRNLQLQKEWFATGQTIRILGQKGGNDYAYMTHIEEGCIADKCWQLYVPKNKMIGNGPVSDTSINMTRIDFSDPAIYDNGYNAASFQYLDDAIVNIPMNGMDFFFDNVNYGSQVKWSSNNVLIFGPTTGITPNLTVNLNGNMCKGIMLGNYDRLCSNIYYSNYNVNAFSITKIIVSFSDYYTDTVSLYSGKLQIRLIKEDGGEQRQWVEVGVISAPSSPGYSNNTSVRYPSGTKVLGGNTVNQDSNGNAIDALKNSPWDISNGTNFLQVAGSSYSTAFPPTGTSMLYESDKRGLSWTFTPNAYLPV